MSFRITGTGTWLTNTTGLASRGFTFAGWLRLRADRNTVTILLQLYAAGAGNNLNVTTNADGTSIEGYTGASTYSLFAATVDAWYYVAIVTTAAGAVTFYYSPAGGGALTAVDGGTVNSFTSTEIDIGHAVYWTSAAFEAYKVWSTNLSAAELTAEQWSRAPVRTVNLVRAWPLWGNATADRADYSGSAQSLTLGGANHATEVGAPIGGR